MEVRDLTIYALAGIGFVRIIADAIAYFYGWDEDEDWSTAVLVCVCGVWLGAIVSLLMSENSI